MKILIIGDANHQYIYNFVGDLKLYFKDSIQIDILSTSKSPIKKSAQVYDQVYNPLEKSKLLAIKGFRVWWRRHLLKIALKNITYNYDICNIHYADKDVLPFITDLRKIAKKIICSIWGSDIYRASEKTLSKQKNFYSEVDIVTFDNKNTLEYFDNIFHFNKSKYRFFTFHLKPLESIQKMKQISREESKRFLNIDPGKVTITIGYSASPGAQHIRIINSLKKDEKLAGLKDKIYFMFPLTYPKIDKYLLKLKQHLNLFPFKFKLFTDFMSNEEIAHLRKATDIFIILTITDQLSGSLLEHLYTQSVVLAGGWLPYDVLEGKGVYFRKVSNSFDNLNILLLDTINNLENERSKCSSNSDIIAKITDWELIMRNWYNIYNDVLSE